MAVLYPVVGMPTYFLLIGIAELGHRRTVGLQSVGDDRRWRAVALQRFLHEGQCCVLVPRPGNEGCCQSDANSSLVDALMQKIGERLCHEGLPLGQGGRASLFIFLTTDEMAFLIEMVGDVGVDAGELLQGLHSPEPEHRPLSSSER